MMRMMITIASMMSVMMMRKTNLMTVTKVDSMGTVEARKF